MYGNTVLLVGNVTRDPELRFTASGLALATFGLAWNYKPRDGEEQVSFFDVVCWRELAENVSQSVGKGMRVMVEGRLQQRSWETDTGDRRSKVEVVADDIAPSLRWATAQVTRNDRNDRGGGGRSGGRSSAPAAAAAAGSGSGAAGGNPDDEPF